MVICKKKADGLILAVLKKTGSAAYVWSLSCAVITRLSGRAITAATKFDVTLLCMCADPEQPSTYVFLNYFVVVACWCQTVQAYIELETDPFVYSLGCDASA